MINACACIGPVGDCPCIRKMNNLPVNITETFISPEVFDCLSDEDKQTINHLKLTAFFKYKRKLDETR